MPLIIEVAKPEQAQRGVFFGAVPCGSCCNRTLSLISKGKAAAQINFALSAELLQQLGIEVIPVEGVTLKPRQTAELTLLYRCVIVTVTMKDSAPLLVCRCNGRTSTACILPLTACTGQNNTLSFPVCKLLSTAGPSNAHVSSRSLSKHWLQGCPKCSPQFLGPARACQCCWLVTAFRSERWCWAAAPQSACC